MGALPLPDVPGPPTAGHGSLTTAQGAALTVGAVLGTGVLTLPAMLAGIAGPASLLAWLALVLLSIPLAATFAALGARYPNSGGVAGFAGRAFGRRASAMVGWCLFFAIPIGAMPAAAFAGGYVADAFGGGTGTEVTTISVLIVLVGGMNAFGLRVSGRVQLALTGALALLLLITVLAAAPHLRLANLTPFAPHGWAAVGSAAAVGVWAFAGWEAVTSLSAEYRAPERAIPRATAVAVAVIGVLYLGVAAAAVLVLGPSAANSRAPLADLLATGLGEPARAATTVAALLLTIGAMNAYFAGAAKLGAALAQQGALPVWLARGASPGEVPRRSLGVVVGLCLLSLAVFLLAGLAVDSSMLLVTGSFTLVYLVGAAAAVRLLPRRSWSRRAAVVSVLGVLVLAATIGVHLLLGVGVAVAALGYDRWSRRRRPARSASSDSPVAMESGRTIP